MNLQQIEQPNPEKAFVLAPSNTRSISVIFSIFSDFYSKRYLTEVTTQYRRSKTTVDALIEDFMRLNLPKEISTLDFDLDQISSSCCSKMFWKDNIFRIVAFPDTRYFPWELSTSVEEPFVSSTRLRKLVIKAYEAGKLPTSRMNKQNLFNVAYVANRTYVHQIKTGNVGLNDLQFECKAHARSHLVKKDKPDKIRLVYGIPWLVLMIEVMFFWPLMNFMRKGRTPILWGYETFTGGLYRLSRYYRPDLTYIMIDWKEFDKRSPFLLIDKFFKINMDHLNIEEYIPTYDYPNGRPKSTKAITALYDWLLNYIKHCPIRLPNGALFKRMFASVPSGCLTTQILDSFINLYVLISVFTYLKISFDFTNVPGEEDFVFVLGDDSIMGIRLNFAISDDLMAAISDAALNLFGFVMNLTKSKVSKNTDEIEVLGYMNDNSFPKRDLDQLIATMMYPERWTSPGKLKARAIGMAYAACGRDIKFHQACHKLYERFKDADLDITGSEYLMYIGSIHPNLMKDSFPSFTTLAAMLDRTTYKLDDTWAHHVFKFEI